MKPNTKEQKLKKLMALDRELAELWKAQRGTPVIKLDKPIRHGWKKFFVLRDDIAKRHDAHVFRQILEQVNHTVYSRKKAFKVKEGKKLVDMHHQLMHIPKSKWNLPDHYKKYFRFCTSCRYSISNYHYNHQQPAYHCIVPYYFTTKIKPHYITHVKTVDGQLESRKQEIYNVMNRGNWPKLMKAYGHSYSGYDRDWERNSERANAKKEIEYELYDTDE